MRKIKEVKEVLDELGTLSTTEIKDLFLKEKITGQKGYCYTCPVSRYIERETGRMVMVTMQGSMAPYGGMWNNPDSVKNFIRLFDDDKMPVELYESSNLFVKTNEQAST